MLKMSSGFSVVLQLLLCAVVLAQGPNGGFDCSIAGCRNGGTCPSGDRSRCICPEGWGGNNCARGFNCFLDGCRNGGTCPSGDRSRCICPEGWSGDNCGRDLCETAECSQICTPSFGSYKCSCNVGYELDGDGLTCNDIDECAYDNGECDQICENTPGSFTCSCLEGYELNHYAVCEDINECADDNGECDQICENTPGSFTCSCLEGYELNHYAVCVDICNPPCQFGGTCVMGSCNCPFGLIGDTCNITVFDCPPPGCLNNGICINDSICICLDGFTGINCEENEMQMGMGGDPHFMVLLQDLHSLCYSVQGMAGFSFNLVSSRDFVMNAVFINARKDMAKHATFLGEIGVLCRLKNEAEGPVKVHFKAVPKTLEISGFGSLDAALVNQVNIKDGEMEVIRSDEPHNWNSEVFINVSSVGISFKIYYQHDHLDLVWSQTSYFNQLQKEQSHGLIGQFFNKGVSIDVKKHELVMPSGRSVRVELKEYWPEVHQKKGNCWRAMNPGYQGDELIEGHYLDYVVDHVFATEFEYSRAFN